MQLFWVWHNHCKRKRIIRIEMEKSKKISRNVFLAIGVIVGILIFILGSHLNTNLRHSEKQEFNIESPKEVNPLVKKFFS